MAETTKAEKGLVPLLRQAFTGFNPDDAQDRGILLQGSAGYHLSNPLMAESPTSQSGTAVVGEQDWMGDKKLPKDRFAKYAVLEEMVTDPVLSAALDMHVSHALSVDSLTGNIITIEAKTADAKEIAASLMAELGPMLNAGLPSWGKLMAVFGVHYIRPYCESGKGVVDIESSWYTMAHQIREYVRGGRLAGFTGEYLKTPTRPGEVQLVEPWQLVGIKVPYWQPTLSLEPQGTSGARYSLYDDIHRRKPIETQDYGTSFLEFAYGSWCDLNDAIRSLKGSRYNASRIDRFVALGMDNLDPARASQYLNLVGSQMRKDAEAAARKGKAKGLIPTVWNQLIPNLSGNKGGVTIDTQMVSPDIQHIEDVMFHLKRMASALGIDVSMLGWGDLMSGGLGDGGFFRTSIQAAIRANWLRVGIVLAVNRLIDIHMAHKYGRVFGAGELRPIEIKFHSLNTAIEAEQADAMETRTNYAMALATVLDTIENGRLAGSDVFKELVLTDIVRLDPDKAARIIKDLAKAAQEAADSEENFMESVGYRGPQKGFQTYLEGVINTQLVNLLGEPMP